MTLPVRAPHIRATEALDLAFSGTDYVQMLTDPLGTVRPRRYAAGGRAALTADNTRSYGEFELAPAAYKDANGNDDYNDFASILRLDAPFGYGSALDIRQTNGSAIRIYEVESGIPSPSAYFAQGAAFYSRKWMVISGNILTQNGAKVERVWGNNILHATQNSDGSWINGAQLPAMFEIWSDVGGPAAIIRGNRIKSDPLTPLRRATLLHMDNDGRSVHAVYDDGALAWTSTGTAYDSPDMLLIPESTGLIFTGRTVTEADDQSWVDSPALRFRLSYDSDRTGGAFAGAFAEFTMRHAVRGFIGSTLVSMLTMKGPDNSDILALDSRGWVGVGDVPDRPFHVKKNTSGLQMSLESGGRELVASADFLGGAAIGLLTADDLNLYTNGTKRVTVRADGRTSLALAPQAYTADTGGIGARIGYYAVYDPATGTELGIVPVHARS